MACSPSTGSVCGPQYDIRRWDAANKSGSDGITYTIAKVFEGQIITANKYDELNSLIFTEMNRRKISTGTLVDPEPNQIILADWYNILANNLTTGLNTQVIAGTSSAPLSNGSGSVASPNPLTGFYGNGSNNSPHVQANPPVSIVDAVNVVPGNSHMVISAEKKIGGNLEDGFNELIDSLIFAGQQCFCNCNYCSCNCNFCTCNCNFACTCNCNYSDETLKINIEEL